MDNSKRSFTMSRIRNINTQPEIKLRSELFKKGFRFRIHKKGLPGKPDIVLSKYHTAIFVHGCFWHQHENCKNCFVPKTRLEYWLPKLKSNAERDKKNIFDLTKQGWKVVVVWECEIRNKLEKIVSKIEAELKINAEK
jgi:DNA mismatch endonuclease, patch repair protein